MARMTRRHNFWVRLLVAVLLTLLLFAAGVVPSDGRALAPEDAVKAAMLYNFVRLVHWPDNAGPVPAQQMVLGIIGRGPLQKWLHDLTAEAGRSGVLKMAQLGSLRELAVRKHELQVL